MRTLLLDGKGLAGDFTHTYYVSLTAKSRRFPPPIYDPLLIDFFHSEYQSLGHTRRFCETVRGETGISDACAKQGVAPWTRPRPCWLTTRTNLSSLPYDRLRTLVSTLSAPWTTSGRLEKTARADDRWSGYAVVKATESSTFSSLLEKLL